MPKRKGSAGGNEGSADKNQTVQTTLAFKRVKTLSTTEEEKEEVMEATPSGERDAMQTDQAATPEDAGERDLCKLLDLSTFFPSRGQLSGEPLNDTPRSLRGLFKRVSDVLVHDYRIVVWNAEKEKEAMYEVVEGEFYVLAEYPKSGTSTNELAHEDPFTHGSEEQAVCGQWYFHRAPRFSSDSTRNKTSLTAYRDGSRKGLDLTISVPASATTSAAQSDQGPQIRGGILLRSIKHVESGRIICGPSLLVDELLSSSSAKDIRGLVEGLWAGQVGAFFEEPEKQDGSGKKALGRTRMFLRRVLTPSTRRKEIFTSPRIGLDLSHPGVVAPVQTNVDVTDLHPRIRFLGRRYRFFTHPIEVVRSGKGRVQTFLGLLRSALKAQLSKTATSAALPAEVTSAIVRNRAKIVAHVGNTGGLSVQNVSKYLDDYLAGRGHTNGTVGGSKSAEKEDVVLGARKKLTGFVGAQGKGATGSVAKGLVLFGALDVVLGEEDNDIPPL